MFVLYFLMISLLVGCSSTPFMGANKIIHRGGDYVERWYLNSEYDKSDIPSGTAFYGAAAKKTKDKFIVKYYINDGNKSDIEIPVSDMWIINHNGKSNRQQDNDNLFIYEKLESGKYVKYKVKGSDFYQVVVKDIPVAIRECNEGWCRLYPHYFHNFKDLYVKQVILKEPLSQNKNEQD